MSCFRSGNSQIAQGLDVHMSFLKTWSLMWDKILKIFMKKSLFPNRSRINLGWSLDHQGMKKHQFESIGSFRNHEKTSKFWKSDKLKNWSRKWQDTIARSYSRSFSPFYGGSDKKNLENPPTGCEERAKTKLKNVLNQVLKTKISRKFSIRGNYSWAYLL